MQAGGQPVEPARGDRPRVLGLGPEPGQRGDLGPRLAAAPGEAPLGLGGELAGAGAVAEQERGGRAGQLGLGQVLAHPVPAQHGQRVVEVLGGLLGQSGGEHRPRLVDPQPRDEVGGEQAQRPVGVLVVPERGGDVPGQLRDVTEVVAGLGPHQRQVLGVGEGDRPPHVLLGLRGSAVGDRGEAAVHQRGGERGGVDTGGFHPGHGLVVERDGLFGAARAVQDQGPLVLDDRGQAVVLGQRGHQVVGRAEVGQAVGDRAGLGLGVGQRDQDPDAQRDGFEVVGPRGQLAEGLPEQFRRVGRSARRRRSVTPLPQGRGGFDTGTRRRGGDVRVAEKGHRPIAAHGP